MAAAERVRAARQHHEPYQNSDIFRESREWHAYAIRPWTRRSLRAVVGKVFEGTGLDMTNVAYFIHANTGKSIVEYAFYRPLGLDPSQSIWDWGCDYGHIGAADHLVNLDYVVRSGRAKVGGKVLTIGVGTGFMWAAVLIEVVQTPAWTSQTG